VKRVLVSQRVDHIACYGENRDALDQRLTTFISAAGGVPFPVPNRLAPQGLLAAWIEHVNPEAIVLSGGNDIGSNPERDATERKLLDYACVHKLPVLGICRGMQMMGVWAGAELIPVTGHVGHDHPVYGDIQATVNSFHNYALTHLPASFRITAHSADDHIEAMCHNELPWEGWMWHPERSTDQLRDLDRWMRLLNANAAN
jgi:N5-(cytidine 5'-diphosphoramidyl)-L-glutamine hydrolase